MSTANKPGNRAKFPPAKPQIISPAQVQKLLASGRYYFDAERRYLCWGGVIPPRFSPKKALIAAVFYENFRNGNWPLTDDQIMSAVNGEIDSCTHADVLRRHPTYNVIFVGDKRGGYWMAIPPEDLELVPSEPKE